MDRTLILITASVAALAVWAYAAKLIAARARQSSHPGPWLRFLETMRAYIADEEPLLGQRGQQKTSKP